MRPSELETWVLHIVDAFHANAPVEDSRVELKTEWPDARRAARRLAGHANAAGGEQILWIIGFDEARGIVGAFQEQFEDWYAQVQAQFESLAPAVIDLNVPAQGKVLVAFLFDTDRAPFVIKNPNYGTTTGGPVQFEVPWREARSTRSATRADLLRILVPAMSLPEVEVLGAEAGAYSKSATKDAAHSSFEWYLTIRFYVVPRTVGEAIVIPFHRCEAALHSPALRLPLTLSNLRISPPHRLTGGGRSFSTIRDSLTVESTSSEVVIAGPGIVSLTANMTTPDLGCDPALPVSATATLSPVAAGRALRVNLELSPVAERKGLAAKWFYIAVTSATDDEEE